MIATGFIAQAKRFGTNDLEDMHLIIEDTLDTMGKVVLGLGLRCARCHDHKYDPTTTEDYYGLYGFFQSTAYPYPGGESVREQRYFVSTIHPTKLAKADKDYFAKHADEIARLEQLIEGKEDVEANKKTLAGIKGGSLASRASRLRSQRWKSDRCTHSARWQSLPQGRGCAATVSEVLCDRSTARDSRRPKRSFATGVLADQSQKPINGPRDGRSNLAISFRTTPIVPTPSNFGLQGTPPTHPELLDWLATQFIASDWSIKAMHRLIMSSETYQLAAAHDADNVAIDSGNQYYWRFDRRRLDAEWIRDSMLLLGGDLDLNRPRAHPFPTKDKWKWTAHRQFKAVYPSNHRSVYLMVQRLHPHPFLSIFDEQPAPVRPCEIDPPCRFGRISWANGSLPSRRGGWPRQCVAARIRRHGLNERTSGSCFARQTGASCAAPAIS